MKKIEFVNGTTIDGASTFNQMQDNVEEVFNGEESMGSIVVEDIECKNIFDKDNANIIKAYANDWSETLFADDNTRSFYIPIISGETYTISRIAGKFFHIATTTELPASGVTRSQYQRANNLTSATITASSTAKYLVVSYYSYASGDTVTEQEVLDSIQIEKGSVATKKVDFKKYGYNENESMGRIVVDDISCKNINNSVLEKGSLNNSTGATVTDANVVRSNGYIKVEPNTTYTISNNKGYHPFVYEYSSSKSFIQYSGKQENPYTFTTSATTNYIKYRTSGTDVENDLTALFQIEKGDKSTTYTPHKKFGYNLDEIEPITLPSSLISLDSSLTANAIEIKKIGKFVQLTLDISGSISQGQTILGTVDKSLVPSYAAMGYGRFTSGYNVYPATGIITSSGAIRLHTTTTGSSTLIQFFYLITNTSTTSTASE